MDDEVEDEKPQTDSADIDYWLAEFEGEGESSKILRVEEVEKEGEGKTARLYFKNTRPYP